MRDNGKEDAHQMRDNEKEDARKRGGGGRIHDTNSFDVEKWGGGADKRWGALWRYSTVYAFLISRVCTARECYYLKNMEKNNAVHYYNLN